MPRVLYVFLRRHMLCSPVLITLAAPFYPLYDRLCGAFPVFLDEPLVKKAFQQQGLGFYVGGATMHTNPDKVLLC